MGISTCQTSRFENVNTNGNEVMSRMRIDFTKTEKEFQLMTLKQGLKQTGVIRVTRSISMILHRSGNNCTIPRGDPKSVVAKMRLNDYLINEYAGKDSEKLRSCYVVYLKSQMMAKFYT
jgi:hypothetical protein